MIDREQGVMNDLTNRPAKHIVTSNVGTKPNGSVVGMVCSNLAELEIRRPFRRIGDGKVQQLNVHDYYELGKNTESLEVSLKGFSQPAALSTIGWQLFMYRWKLREILAEPCALLNSSQRAVKAIISAIAGVVSEDISEVFDPEKSSAIVQPYQMRGIGEAITNFETVLKNDMPEMSTFAVAQIGMYRTEDLIGRSILQIDEGVRDRLLPLAKSDILEAGKCLAFRVPTAAAFHLSRAIETCMNQYFEALTGKPYDLKPGANNWGNKIKLLEENGAAEKITAFLLHIKNSYRNPITHPDVILDASEAFNFFPQALGVISMMLAATRAIEDKRQPMLDGFEGILGGLDAGWTKALGIVEPVGQLRSGDEENSDGAEAEDSAQD
jgi:hypothetical protein